MKNILNLLLNLAILYAIYHLLPWPTAISIYGSIVLCVHIIAICAAFYFARNPHKFTKRYKRSITWDFAMAAFSIIIYLTSQHEITQYLAISISAVFTCIYFIRYKTQQLF